MTDEFPGKRRVTRGDFSSATAPGPNRKWGEGKEKIGKKGKRCSRERKEKEERGAKGVEGGWRVGGGWLEGWVEDL